jgi:hypothetical protein
MTKAQQLGIRDTEFPYREYDSNGKQTYYENSDGSWLRCEYDSNGKITYQEDSDDYWFIREFDSDGNTTYYYENSDDSWFRCEYDSDGNTTYYEDSLGKIIGTKRDTKDKIINDQFNQIEEITKRCNEAEIFIMGLNWFERLFISRKVRKFIQSRLKYKF